MKRGENPRAVAGLGSSRLEGRFKENMAERVGFEYTIPVELSLNINVLGTVVYWDLKDS